MMNLVETICIFLKIIPTIEAKFNFNSFSIIIIIFFILASFFNNDNYQFVCTIIITN